MSDAPAQFDHRRGQWKKLGALTLAMVVLVAASLTWSAWRRRHPEPGLPVLIPGAIIQPPAR
jgi:hypothetical protein